MFFPSGPEWGVWRDKGVWKVPEVHETKTLGRKIKVPSFLHLFLLVFHPSGLTLEMSPWGIPHVWLLIEIVWGVGKIYRFLYLLQKFSFST